MLQNVALEIEQFVSKSGWDQGVRLFALADSRELFASDPELAAELGVADAAGITPVEVEFELDGELDDALGHMAWPENVTGCAIALERLLLPPSAEAQLPEAPESEADLIDAVASHPEREEVRIVVVAMRDGQRHCALRLRSRDSEQDVLTGVDLLPRLADALVATLQPDE